MVEAARLRSCVNTLHSLNNLLQIKQLVTWIYLASKRDQNAESSIQVKEITCTLTLDIGSSKGVFNLCL